MSMNYLECIEDDIFVEEFRDLFNINGKSFPFKQLIGIDFQTSITLFKIGFHRILLPKYSDLLIFLYFMRHYPTEECMARIFQTSRVSIEAKISNALSNLTSCLKFVSVKCQKSHPILFHCPFSLEFIGQIPGQAEGISNPRFLHQCDTGR